MTDTPVLIAGLHEIAPRYDALICDVWGVIHNGAHAHAGAIDALRRFRATFGPVVLLSNAPRPVSVLVEQFKTIGVPSDCYDSIITSGVATREDLAIRSEGTRLALFHLGPERDRGLFAGLPIDCVDPKDASIVLCTGPFDDENETPEDYREMLTGFAARNLVMLCANPDIVVQRGAKLIYCAGAIARAYEALGGTVVYYGKPHAAIYQPVLVAAVKAAGRAIQRPLAIGDGLETDIRGANGVGIDALFVADGIYKAGIGAVNPGNLARVFEKTGVTPGATLRRLVW
jgi:HAD superfamily hydrolase (TIGR01459 family)